MIHFGKTPIGELEILISADNVGEIYEALNSAGLLQRRTFHNLKDYVEREFKGELQLYRRRMTSQLPAGQEGEDNAHV